MKQKILLSLVAVLLTALSAQAYDFQSGDLYYNITSDSTVEVTYQYPFSSKNYSGLTSVTIPSSVTYNGTTYSVVSIGIWAFYSCTSLTTITIPNSIKEIGVDAFAGTRWFNNLPDGVVYINNILYKYKGIMPQNTSITIPQGIISINSHAFQDCTNLTSISIPNSVTSIGQDAFDGCSNLTSISFPNSLTNIGVDAFAGTPWFNNLPDGVVYINNILYKYKGIMPQNTSITIPQGIISINSNAFYNCSGLTSITIPNTVTNIGDLAFSRCSNLTSISIPNSVTTIGYSALAGCSSLASITIPNSVTKIGNQCFGGCSSLSSIIVDNGNPNYDSRNNCNAIIETASNSLISGCSSTVIPNTVTSIEKTAFLGCANLTSITIPNNVTSIGSSAFQGCSGLTSITLPNSIMSIEDCTFWNCSSLVSITIPNTVTNIGEMAFENCSSLTSIIIPNGVTNIRSSTFRGCSSLTSIIIPNSITKIGDGAFGNCSQLMDITCESANPPICYYDNYFNRITSFENVPSNCIIKVPCHSLATYNKRAPWNQFQLKIIPPPSLQVQPSSESLGSTNIDQDVDCDSTAIVSATANYGYHFVQWSDSVTVNPRLIKLTIDTVLTAEFARNAYNITLTHDGEGTIESDTTALYQDTIALNAVADYGWQFSGWSDGVLDNPRSIVVTADCEYHAIFVRQQFSLTAIAENGVVDGVGTFAYEDTCQLTATPNTGYHFVQWNDCVTENPRTIVLTQDTNLTAEFAKNSYQITTSHTGNGMTMGDTTALYQDTITLSALADYGWEFGSWSDNNVGRMDNPRTIVVTADCEYYAIFVRQQFSLTAIAENGVVDGVGTFAYEDTCQLTAIANVGYHFVQWNDGVTENPRMIVLTQDTNLTAEFAKNAYSIALSHAGKGNISGDTTALYQDTIALNAVADYGWQFSGWSDGVLDNPRSIVVTADCEYHAIFVRQQFSLTANAENGVVDGVGTFAYGDTCQLTAIANVGYHFVQWSDSITDNPRSIVLTQDTTLTALFAQSFAGQCGDSLYWNYGDNELNITGTGAMYDYTKTTMPWMLFRDSIYLIRIGDSATYIGEYAFAGCPNLGTLFVGESVDTIAENTLANCRNLHVVYCYPTIPPYAENNSFMNYNGYLYVPCDSKRNYSLDYVWGNFKYIVCLGTEDVTVTNDSVIVVADNATATFTWPATDDAETYSIVITKDGEVFCTLIFNTQGQLMTIAFAPSKDGSHHAPAAQLTANGYQFTVRGLESETHYAFTLDAKDEERNVVAHYAGTFDTYNETAVENVPTESNVRKIYRDGNVYIIRDGEEYSILGQKL